MVIGRKRVSQRTVKSGRTKAFVLRERSGIAIRIRFASAGAMIVAFRLRAFLARVPGCPCFGRPVTGGRLGSCSAHHPTNPRREESSLRAVGPPPGVRRARPRSPYMAGGEGSEDTKKEQR